MEKPVILSGSQPSSNNFNAFADYAEFVANEAAGNNFAQDPATTGALQWGHVGGVVRNAAGTIIIVPAGVVALTASTPDIFIVADNTGAVSAQTVAPDATVKPIRHLATDAATIITNDDVRVGFDFAGSDGAGVSSWNDLQDKPATVAESGLADAATTANVADEATARANADTALQDEIDAEEAARAAHVAAAAPHSGHMNLNGSTPLTGHWNVGGFRLTNLLDPISAQEPATKAYVDAIAAGLQPRALSHAATTGNINLANPGTSTFDNVALTAGQYLLVHKQTTLTENGFYVFNGSGVPLTRRTDFDSSAEVVYGAYTFVLAGSEWGGYGLFALVPSPFTLGSDPIEFSVFSGGQPSGEQDVQNVGTGTGLLHKITAGLTHFFRSIKAGSNRLSISTSDDEVSIDINEGNLNLANMGGTLPTGKIAVLQTATLGEILIGVGGNSWGKIARNVTTTRKYLYQIGDGAGVTDTGYGAIRVIDLPVAQPSGANHAGGAVPTPGPIAGTLRVLHEDMLWKIPANSGGWKATSATPATIPVEVPTLPVTTRAFNIGSASYAFAPAMRVRMVNLDNTDDWMEGPIKTYISQTINVEIQMRHGSSAYNINNWSIFVVPEPIALEDIPEHEHTTNDITDFEPEVRRVMEYSTGAPVANLAGLRAVSEASRQDRQTRLVESSGILYRFDVEGVGVDDNNGTIAPDVGTGRWFKIGEGTDNANTLDGQDGAYYLDLGNATGTLNEARLANSGAVAGSYTNANVTVDDKGRIINVEDGTGSSAALNEVWLFS